MHNNDFNNIAQTVLNSCLAEISKEINTPYEELKTRLLQKIMLDECLSRIQLAIDELNYLSNKLNKQNSHLDLRKTDGVKLSSFISNFNSLYERSKHQLNQEQKSQIDEMYKKLIFQQAQLMANNHMMSKESYESTSTYFSFIWGALASIGLCNKDKQDIYYDPALSKVGLTPEVVDKLLLEAKVRNLDKLARTYYIMCRNNIRDMIDDYSKSISSNLKYYDINFNLWKQHTSLNKDELKNVAIQFS